MGHNPYVDIVSTPNGNNSFSEFVKEMLDLNNTPPKEQHWFTVPYGKVTSVGKKPKSEIVFAFPYNSHYFMLIDNSETCNNFSLKVRFPNKKHMVIDGVGKIIDYLRNTTIPLEFILEVEKHLFGFVT